MESDLTPFDQFLVKYILIPKRFLFSFQKQEKVYWDIFIILLSIFNSFSTPVRMANNFNDFEGSDEHTQRVGIKIIENFVDACFTIDLIVAFFTSFRNNKGIEVWDSKLIALNYIMSKRFLTDFGSLIGQTISYINPESPLTILSVLKMTRIMRIGRAITESNMNKN